MIVQHLTEKRQHLEDIRNALDAKDKALLSKV
jgi:hypothetical protein